MGAGFPLYATLANPRISKRENLSTSVRFPLGTPSYGRLLLQLPAEIRLLIRVSISFHFASGLAGFRRKDYKQEIFSSQSPPNRVNSSLVRSMNRQVIWEIPVLCGKRKYPLFKNDPWEPFEILSNVVDGRMIRRRPSAVFD
jgi:hypothetical protein